MTPNERDAPRTGSGFARRTLPNILAVARRELMYRVRTRAYRFTTVFLVIAGVALALAPTIIAWFDRDSTGDRIEVVAGDALPGVDAAAAFQQLLNASAGTPTIPIGGQSSPPRFTVVTAPDPETAKADVIKGTAAGAIVISRNASGDLRYDAYTNASSASRSVAAVYQAATSIAIQDRLSRAGVPPVDQASLFTPPVFDVQSPDPNGPKRTDPASDPGAFLTGFGLSIAIFMAILLYGQWIAYSVAEEKSSRVMEIVLAAATPFQLLAGKVIGVGALALLQYFIVSIPMIAALLFQDQIASVVLGTPAGGAAAGGAAAGGVDVGASLSIGMVATFGVMLVLGFAVYASLYAGAASLVTRQEDINQIVAPLTFISVIGYLVATYSSTGLIPPDSPFVIVLSFVPLFSPYLMLTRLSTGTAGPIEVLIAIVLLALTVPVALWIAARLYRSGVLMYGQPPSPRTLLRALRS
ncbi:MAG TPA: ABC transporter permease [Candidatus Limnocylindrales bacterium]|nr:ABC transporter permease [Candidatus Limnocylindrales bacterium]